MSRRVILWILLVFLFVLMPARGLVTRTQAQAPADGNRISANVRAATTRGEQVRVLIALATPGRERASLQRQDIAELQERVVNELGGSGFVAGRRYNEIPLMSGLVNAQALNALERNPNISFVMEDLEIQTQAGNNGSAYVGAQDVQARGFTGLGVTVAVLDTGIAPASPLYTGVADAVVAEQCFAVDACYPFLDDSSQDANDGGIDGHGTIVTDIITGPDGYAPDTRIVAVRILDDEGGGYLSDWLAGLEWVRDYFLDYDISLVNMSIGTVQTFAPDCDNANPVFADVATVINQLVTVRRIDVFAASGNNGVNGELAAPACFSNVTSVAATYAEDFGRMPVDGTYAETGSIWPNCVDFSTGPDRIACFSNNPADLSAPGVHTFQTNQGEIIIYGTSFASPAAVGVAALIKQAAPSADASILLATGATTTLNPDGSAGPPQVNATSSVNLAEAAQECDIYVSDGNVYGGGGLVGAINRANQTGETICLAPGGSYVLTALNAGVGLPRITGNVLIVGNDATIMRDVNAAAFRLFQVEPAASLTLSNLNLSGGLSSEGAAVYNRGYLDLRQSSLYGHEASGDGGAIYNDTGAQAYIRASSLNYNSAGGDGGALFSRGGFLGVYRAVLQGNGAGGAGGAISDESALPESLEISATLISGNNADGVGGGLADTAGSSRIEFVRFEDNYSLASAGGLYLTGNSFIEIDHVRFARNLGANAAGALQALGVADMTISSSEFLNNSTNAIGGALGGAIVNSSSLMKISDSTFDSNFSIDAGGAIHNFGGTVEINRSAFNENYVQSSNGAVYYSTSGGTLKVVNSSFHSNRGINGFLLNGALDVATFSFSTIASSGNITTAVGTVNLKNMLFSGTSGCNITGGTFNVAGFNYAASATCAGVTQVTAGELALGAYQDNGGPTFSMALAEDSIAVNVVPTINCTDYGGGAVLVDQRGETRDSRCDVGAFEYTLPEPKPFFTQALGSVVRGVDAYSYSDQNTDNANEAGEPTDCFADPTDARSQHIGVSGTSIFRGLAAGSSIFRGLASGGVYYSVDTSASTYDTQVGVYQGDELVSLTSVGCGSEGVLIPISAEDAENEIPYRVIIWDADKGASGDVLSLSILDQTFKGCADISGIPPEQCEALLQFYENTDGPTWDNSGVDNHWLNTNIPCAPFGLGGWQGVECMNGQVSGLSLPGGWAVDRPAEYPTANEDYAHFLSLIETPVGQGIIVTTTSMTVANDGLCSLIEAILAANSNTASGAALGECAAGTTGTDTITLGSGKVYRLLVPYGGTSNGLPVLSSNIIIEGNGSRIERSTAPGTPEFRLMTINNNSSVELRGLTLRNGRLDSAFSAGAVNVGVHSDLKLTDTFFTQNVAGYGGAVRVDGVGSTLEVVGSIFYRNTSLQNGGALFVGNIANVVIRDSSFIENRSSRSSGALEILNAGGSNNTLNVLVENTTFGDNSALTAGGGVGIGSYGGGDLDTQVTMRHVTFVGNDAADGVFSLYLADNASSTLDVSFAASIFSGNAAASCSVVASALTPTFSSGGFNILDDASCQDSLAEVGDLHLLDAEVGLLRLHGGSTPSYALLPGSPAIDAVPLVGCALSSDQRGVARPQGNGCDAGAYEYINALPIARNDLYTTPYQQALSVGSELGVLANDSDPEGLSLVVVQALTQPQHAESFILRPDGSFDYVPLPNVQNVVDSIQYEISDGIDSSTGILRIAIGPVPMTQPSNLTVVSGLETTPVLPVLRWTHRNSESATEAGGKWYRVRLYNNANGALLLDTWVSAENACLGVVCQLNIGNASGPVSLKVPVAWGLGNGTYDWSVQAWYAAGQLSAESISSFGVAISAPFAPGGLAVLDKDTGEPEFTWNHAANATWYEFVLLNNSSGVIRQKWYQAADLGCGDGLCSVDPNVYLKNGDFSWRVRAWGPGGMTGFTNAAFTVAAPVLTTPVLVGPEGAQANANVVFSWQAGAGASWYQLLIKKSGVTVYNQWLTAASAGCAQSTSCMIQTPLILTSGSYTWELRAYSPYGMGVWTAPKAFSLP